MAARGGGEPRRGSQGRLRGRDPACDTPSDDDSIPCNDLLNFAAPDHRRLIPGYELVWWLDGV